MRTRINLNTIPNNWKWVKIENLLDFVIGGDWGKDENYEDNNYQLAYCIRGSEIRNWDAEKGSTASLRKIKKSNIERRKLTEGDILLEISGGGPDQPVGRTVLIDKPALNYKPGIPKICTNFLRLLRPIDTINPKFLNHYLCFFYKSGEIVNFQGGSNNLRNLKFPDYIKIEVPVPPIEMQRAIVSKIEELFSELDKGIVNLKLAQEQLKVYRQSVLKWAFEGRLTNENVKEGELPKGWKWHKLNDIVDKISDGPFGSNLKTSDYVSSGIRVIRLENIGVLQFRDKLKSFISVEKYKTLINHTVKAGDIIFSSFIIDNIRSAILPFNIEKGINKADCFLVRCTSENINNKYLCYYFATTAMKLQLESLVHGATRPRINTTQLKSAIIPVCSKDEQLRIVDVIEDRLGISNKLEEMINQSLQQSEGLRQSILKRAFEGKL